MKTRTYTMPSAWASALVNGDYSGMDARDIAACEAHLARLGHPQIVSTVDDSAGRFTWCFRLYGGYCDGGDVIDYVALVPDDAKGAK